MRKLLATCAFALCAPALVACGGPPPPSREVVAEAKSQPKQRGRDAVLEVAVRLVEEGPDLNGEAVEVNDLPDRPVDVRDDSPSQR